MRYLCYVIVILLLASCSDFDGCINNEPLQDLSNTTTKRYFISSSTDINHDTWGVYGTSQDANSFSNPKSITYDPATTKIQISGSATTCQGDPKVITDNVLDCDPNLDYNGDGIVPSDNIELGAVACTSGKDYESWRDTVRLGIFNENIDWNGDGYVYPNIPREDEKFKIHVNDYKVWQKKTKKQHSYFISDEYRSTVDYNGDGAINDPRTYYESGHNYWTKQSSKDAWNDLITAWEKMEDYTKDPNYRLNARADALAISTDKDMVLFSSKNNARIAPYMSEFEMHYDYDRTGKSLTKDSDILKSGVGYQAKLKDDLKTVDYVQRYDIGSDDYVTLTKTAKQVRSDDEAAFKIKVNNRNVQLVTNQWYRLTHNNVIPNDFKNDRHINSTWNQTSSVNKTLINRRKYGDPTKAYYPFLWWPGEELEIKVGGEYTNQDGDSYTHGKNLWMIIEYLNVSGMPSYYSGGSNYQVWVNLGGAAELYTRKSSTQIIELFNNTDLLPYVHYGAKTGLNFQSGLSDHMANQIKLNASLHFVKDSSNNEQKYNHYVSYKLSNNYGAIDQQGKLISGKLNRYAKIYFAHESLVKDANSGYIVQARIAPCKSSGIKRYLFARQEGGGNIFPVFIKDEKIQGLTGGVKKLEFKIVSNVDKLYYDDYKDAYKSQYSYGQDGRGTYRITVKESTKQTSGNITRFVNFIMTPVRQVLYGSTDASSLLDQRGIIYGSYQAFIKSGYATFIYLLITAYITYHGIMILAGLSSMHRYHFIVMAAKIAFVLLAFNATDGWKVIGEIFFAFFVEGLPSLANAVTGDVLANSEIPASQQFLFLDAIIDPFFSANTWKKLASLLVTGFIGLLYIYLVLMSVVTIFFVTLKVLTMYIFSVLAIAILLAMAPLFISFIIFKFTKTMFDKWWQAMFSYSLQPLLMMLVMVIMSNLILYFLYMVISFEVCWGCVFKVVIPFDEIDDNLPRTSFCILSWYIPWGWSFNLESLTLPISFFHVLALKILVDAFERLVGWAAVLAQAIAGSYSTGLNDVASKAYNAIGTRQYNLDRAQNLASDGVKKGVKTVGRTGAAVVASPAVFAKNAINNRKGSVAGRELSTNKERARAALKNTGFDLANIALGSITDRFNKNNRRNKDNDKSNKESKDNNSVAINSDDGNNDNQNSSPDSDGVARDVTSNNAGDSDAGVKDNASQNADSEGEKKSSRASRFKKAAKSSANKILGTGRKLVSLASKLRPDYRPPESRRYDGFGNNNAGKRDDYEYRQKK